MARRPRLHLPGGFYHVTLRGNHQQPIFFEESDRDLMDGIVDETVGACGVRIHAFCWMTNHMHLLAQVSDVPLGRTILRIASRYARKVQRRLGTTGHLFERRYHCKLVDADRYFLALLRYIHLNPVSAGMVRDPVEYQWSSHRDYLGLASRPWLTTDFALATLGATRTSAISAYRALIGATGVAPIDLRPNSDFKDILGDDAFVKRVTSASWQPRSRLTLDDLVRECCVRFDLAESELAGTSRSSGAPAARAWLANEAVERRITSVSAVARRLGRSEAALRQGIKRYPRVRDDRPS